MLTDQHDKSVFLVKTPLQLLNALEAKQHFNLTDEETVLIVFADRVNRTQMESLIDIYKVWGRAIYLDDVNLFFGDPLADEKLSAFQRFWSGDRFSRSLFYLRKLNRLSRAVGKTKYIFLGYGQFAYMKHFMNVTPHQKAIQLDDGNVTLKLAREVGAGRSSVPGNSLRKRVKTVLKRTFQGMKDGDAAYNCFFTVYDIPPGLIDEVISNRYSFVSEKISDQRVGEKIYFLGSPLGKGIIDQDLYIKALNTVKAYFRDEMITYIAHRREKPGMLERIRNDVGFEVERFPYPIEFQLISDNERPKILASFFSSALDTCQLIFGDKLDIYAFKLNLEGSPRRDDIYAIYDNYRHYTQGFAVVDVDEIE